MTPDIRTFSDRQAAAEALAHTIAGCLRDAIAARGQAAYALSGGSTPGLVYPQLTRATVNWETVDWVKVTFTLIDDRWVPEDHEDSNQGLAERGLLQGAAAAARMVGLKTDAARPGDALDNVEKRLNSLAWPLDGAFLGMGEDGHVASLFPEDTRWADAAGRAYAVPSMNGRHARMSFTPAALLDCRALHLIVFGAKKHAVLDKAMKPGPYQDLPIRLVLHQTQVPVTVFVAP